MLLQFFLSLVNRVLEKLLYCIASDLKHQRALWNFPLSFSHHSNERGNKISGELSSQCYNSDRLGLGFIVISLLCSSMSHDTGYNFVCCICGPGTEFRTLHLRYTLPFNLNTDL